MPLKIYVAPCVFGLLIGASAVWAQSESIKYRRVFEIEPGKTFHFELNVDAAEVKVEKNDREREISVLLEYTEDAFEYNFDYDERGRSLIVDFDKKHWIKSESDQLTANVEVLLPAAATLDLSGRIKAGEIDMHLGDLSINQFETKIWAGEVRIDFQKPNRIPMRWFEVNTKVGSTKLRRLGNARFRFAEINSGIGELYIDFSGALRSDASARVDLDIGETRIYIPEDVGTKLYIQKFLFLSQTELPIGFEKMGKFYLSENYDMVGKKFDLKVNPGIGELTIRYR